jgi:hypothetical protein
LTFEIANWPFPVIHWTACKTNKSNNSTVATTTNEEAPSIIENEEKLVSLMNADSLCALSQTDKKLIWTHRKYCMVLCNNRVHRMNLLFAVQFQILLKAISSLSSMDES